MKGKLYTIAVLLFISSFIKLSAQTLPSGTCGIVYTYDAAGNRTKSEYVLNNTTTTADVVDSQKIAIAKNISVIQVDALYPNPTTGQFSVRLTKSLANATVRIMDIGGHIILNTIANGNILTYNIANQQAGIYFLQIIQPGQQQPISMKIIKR